MDRFFAILRLVQAAASRAATAPLIFVLMCYKRYASPLLGDRCRFYPYCSNYAIESLQVHGLFKGLLLIGWRVVRCHPYHPGGEDPVPSLGRWSNPGNRS